jgi:hypothetical protein
MKIELKSIIYRLLAYIIVMSVFALIVHGIVFIDNKFDEKISKSNRRKSMY